MTELSACWRRSINPALGEVIHFGSGEITHQRYAAVYELWPFASWCSSGLSVRKVAAWTGLPGR